MAKTPALEVPPPDGGWGLIVAVSAHVMYVLAVGMFRCSGVFYTSWLHEFETSALQTATIGSVVGCCSFFGSPLAAVVCGRYGCRFTGILGGMVMVVGLFGSYWVRTIYQMYAVCAIAGLGIAFVIMAANVVVIQYFKRYFTIANGFVMSGVGVGMIVQPLLLGMLKDQYGWRGAMLIFASITGNICVAAAVFRPLQPGRKHVEYPQVGESRQSEERPSTTALLELEGCDNKGKNDTLSSEEEALRAQDSNEKAPLRCVSKVFSSLGFSLFRRNFRFALFCLIQVQLNISYAAFLVFIVPRAESIDVGVTSAATLLSIIGFGSLIGRLASGCLINPKLTAEVVFSGSTLTCFAGVLAAQFGSYGALAASAGLMGLGTGVMKSAHNVLVRDLVGVPCYGRGLGMADIFRGIGDLLGPVIAGRLYDDTRSYAVMFYAIAALFLAIIFQMAVLMPVLKKVDSAVRQNSKRNTESEHRV